MSEPRLQPELAEWIGRERGPVPAPGPIEWSDVRRYVNATGDTNPRWRQPSPGAPVPPAMILDVLRPGPGEDNPANGGDRPFPSLSGLAAMVRVPNEVVRLNAATEVEWFRPLRIGDWISVHFRILDISRQPTHLGPAVFITEERRHVDQHGEVVAVIRQTTARILEQSGKS